MVNQQTISRPFVIEGVGLHSGIPALMQVRPAPLDHGIVFRVGSDAAGWQDLPAHVEHVDATELRTELRGAGGVRLATVEHFLAACRGVAVDNLSVEVQGTEVPIMDGSARPFCEALRGSGLEVQPGQRRVLRVLKPVRVASGSAEATIGPIDHDTLVLGGEIDFAGTIIGRQRLEVQLDDGVFEDALGFARTFGFASQLDDLKGRGLALGGTLDNAILVDGDSVVNPEGLRAPDEFIRHKLLDAVGDLSLAGAPIIGRYEAIRPGHALNAALVRALLADPSAWRWEIG